MSDRLNFATNIWLPERISIIRPLQECDPFPFRRRHVGCIPSGKRLHSYGKIHHFRWVNQLFPWPFSIAMLNYQEGNY